MVVVDLQPIQFLLAEGFQWDGVADPLYIATVVDLIDEVQRGVTGTHAQALFAIFRQPQLFQRFIQPDTVRAAGQIDSCGF